MSLRFVIGRAGSEKRYFCLEEIRARLRELPMGSPLIYLVPEQMTFQSESILAKTPNLQGMMRAQVYSFRRLAWKILQEVGGIAREHINKNGIKMVLHRVIAKHQDELRLFGRASSKLGFTAQLEELYTELKRYRVDSSQLRDQYENMLEKREQGPEYRLLADKLHDLHLIYSEVEQFLAGHYLDSEDYLRLLAEKVAVSHYLKDAEIWIDGFHGFTPQEYAVILSLLHTCKRVTVCLTLDQFYTREQLEGVTTFYPTGETYHRLCEMAEKLGVETECINLHTSNPHTLSPYTHPDLACLEQQLGDQFVHPNTETPNGIAILQAVNRRAEVEGIAREIIRLAREEGYRYKEISILVRQAEVYQDLIATVFSEYEIPVFIDAKRPMLQHPFIEFLRSTFELFEHHWSSEALFRCLKTDLVVTSLFPGQSITQLRDRIDRFENVVLTYGITGSRWIEKGKWELGSEDQFLEVNELRHIIVSPFLSLMEDLQAATYVKDKMIALHQYFERLQIPAQLEAWSHQAKKDGRLQHSREHGQVWTAVMNLCDQMVELMGEEELSLESFSQVLRSGLEELSFSLVPPALDQLLVGTMDRTRLVGIKTVFLLGINEGVLPARPVEDGIIYESERDLLGREGLELAPSSERRLLEEELLIYSILTTATERLYLSYPMADEEGKGLTPSSVITKVKEIFPNISESLLFLEPASDRELEFIHHPRSTLSQLAIQLRGWQKGYPLQPIWLEIYNWYIQHPIWKGPAIRLLGSLFYQNQEKWLTKETSRALYGSHLKASISRLEQYTGCPFSHFAAYGLHLQERNIYRLETPDIGQFFHDALNQMTVIVKEQGREWADLQEEEVAKLSHIVVDQLKPVLKKQILLSSNRMQYIGYKLRNIINRAGMILREHSRYSQFTPLGTEMVFAAGGSIPTLQFTLANGCTMELVGRIDRIDQARGEKGVYIRVIDYKSSQKSLDLSEAYFGLALQMLAYLDVVVSHADSWLGEKAIPAGMLYFHVHNPILSTDGPISKEEMERKILSKFKLRGLVVEDLEAVRLMDQQTSQYAELNQGFSSRIPVRLNKEGGLVNSQSSLVSYGQLEQLRQHVRQVIQEVGTGITDGNVEIAPYQLKKKKHCTFCVYKPICQFDQLYEENQFRRLKSFKKDEIWNELAQKGGTRNEEHSDEANRSEMDR